VTAEDHSFQRLLTPTEIGGESIRHSRGAYDAIGQHDLCILGREPAVQHPTSNCATRVRHSGGGWLRLWRTEFSSVKKGRFLEDLSAFRGRTLGILGAHNPICTSTSPVVGCPLFVEMWEFAEKNRAAYGRGKRCTKSAAERTPGAAGHYVLRFPARFRY
jgi:hypothetical protein